MRKAFTLAEVLITLIVIGVIASLSVPALITNIQDAQYKTAWKKTYSDLNQAVTRLLMNNGGTLINLCNDYNNNCFRSKLLSHLSYVKDCPPGFSEGNCWGTWGTDLGAFLLANGSSVKTEWSNADCNNNTWHSDLPKCGMIWVDVNGFKGPDMWGKDLYAIQVLENGMKPMGVPGDGLTVCSPPTSNTSNGYACSAMYLKQ